MKRWQWLIAACALVALLLIAWAFHVDAEQVPPAPPLYQGIPYDPSLLALDRRALEEAYHQQMIKLFLVWLQAGAPDDATQFKNGLRIARKAYGAAREQIRKREEQLDILDLDRQGREERKQ